MAYGFTLFKLEGEHLFILQQKEWLIAYSNGVLN